MSFFRPRLTCFYCGRSASSRWTKGVTQFHCQHCEAVNYLDEVRLFHITKKTTINSF